ncbi:hypothetical protein FRB90_002940, partial [Tulasnella sp. 427]
MVPLRLFNGLEPLPRLREFHCMLCPEEFSGIPEFLEELTRACPNLQHLVIYARVQVFFTEPESFTLQAISPLFACHSLIELQIFHTRAFKLNSEQIRTIGHSLPLLETLALCPNVLFPEAGQTAMHLSQLTNFGPTWFPSLKRLAVCVETLHPPTPSRSKDVFQVEAFCEQENAIQECAKIIPSQYLEVNRSAISLLVNVFKEHEELQATIINKAYDMAEEGQLEVRYQAIDFIVDLSRQSPKWTSRNADVLIQLL